MCHADHCPGGKIPEDVRKTLTPAELLELIKECDRKKGERYTDTLRRIQERKKVLVRH